MSGGGLLLFKKLSVSVGLGGRRRMNPFHWRREYQVAWIVFCLVGGMAGLFFAWLESPVRVMANYTMEVNPSLMFLLWLLRPLRYWHWPLFGISFVGLTFYAAMLVFVRSK
jgi:hypothetical protein